MGETPADEKPHAVCVPFPAQGHVTPMLKLAKILYCKGFHITFVNTEYNHRRLIRSRGVDAVAGLPGFRFATIPDGLPPSDANATQESGPGVHMLLHHDHLPPPLQELACRPQPFGLYAVGHVRRGGQHHEFQRGRREGDQRAVRAILDGQRLRLHGLPTLPPPHREGSFPPPRAHGLVLKLSIGSTKMLRLQSVQGMYTIQWRDEEQLTNGFLDTPVDWARGMSKHMRIGDFPSFVRSTDRGDILFNFLLRETERASAASAVILNTFDELEQTAIDAMHAILPPVYTVGPLNLLTKQLVADGPVDTLDSNLWEEEHACLDWLDGRNPTSVVYVNYGSVTVMTSQELVEFAWGLANSGYEFLWIIRPDLVRGDIAVLPPEFLEATKDRGLLASWCPQEAVLRHEAVGLFLMHGGWNSTLESLCGGVPMLCWPFFADQQTNCRYMSVEWGVGTEINHDVRRDAVEERIREAMGGEKGREMRRRAVEWKETAVRATQPGARSFANLEKLVRDVLLSSTSC